MQKKKLIFITTQFEGFHKYENAPEEVAFLRNYHRHMFHVRVTIEVYHEDRELEFIIVKRLINDRLKALTQRLSEGVSCEAIADTLYEWAKQRYGSERVVSVEVNEDGENGAIVGDL